tara:strand:- start:700 stop:888 length:189 start_codon:yes stop_codon:yes gene_type:complete
MDAWFSVLVLFLIQNKLRLSQIIFLIKQFILLNWIRISKKQKIIVKFGQNYIQKDLDRTINS